MNITFLVGNGFDLSAGLRTAYRDFYDWYCAQPSGNLDIQMFKTAFGTMCCTAARRGPTLSWDWGSMPRTFPGSGL